MRAPSMLTVGCLIGAMLAGPTQAQPGPRGDAGRQPPPRQEEAQHYYNGRWVGQDEWSRHSAERDSWARQHQQRRGRNDDSTALIAGILGFALGAAIVGSSQQAEHARTADTSWDSYCARKYRSYDRRSRTYLGVDGLRHYCQ